MAREQLTWRNIDLNAMPTDLRKHFTAWHQSHAQMVAWFEADAKRNGKLNGGSVKISPKENAIGFAIAANGSRTTVSNAKALWD